MRIATRQSPLALWQAEHVAAALRRHWPGLAVTLVPMTTAGDRRLGESLSTAGGKGLFVKELEQALQAGAADVAVHSMKDVPAAIPAPLKIAALLAGEDPRDALVTRGARSLAELPAGATVGTASLRRQAQLRARRPDLVTRDVRGNVGTRLRKLDAGEFDALLLACAGLQRLGLAGRISEAFDVDSFVPAIGQGVIGVEARGDDADTLARLAPLHDAATAARIAAERALNQRLGGACTVPVAGHAVMTGERLRLTGLVAAPDGSDVVRDAVDGPAARGAQLGEQLAERLLARGGRRILAALGMNV